jgi:hypothetical protein
VREEMKKLRVKNESIQQLETMKDRLFGDLDEKNSLHDPSHPRETHTLRGVGLDGSHLSWELQRCSQ